MTDLEALERHLEPGEEIIWWSSAWPGLTGFLEANRYLVLAAGVGLGISLVALLPFPFWAPDSVRSAWTRQAAATLGLLSLSTGLASRALAWRTTYYFVTSRRVGEIQRSGVRWVQGPGAPVWTRHRRHLVVEWAANSGTEGRSSQLAQAGRSPLRFLTSLADEDGLRDALARSSSEGSAEVR